MKTKIVILSVLVLMVGVLIGCTPAPTPCCQCNGENEYAVEGNCCIALDDDYGPDFNSALDSLLRYRHFDPSEYTNYFFTVDTIRVLDHPDGQNRTFLGTELYVDGGEQVITGHIYPIYSDLQLKGRRIYDWWWIIDTKGDVYFISKSPPD